MRFRLVLSPDPPSTLQEERGVLPDPPFLFGGGSGNKTRLWLEVMVL